MTDNEIIKAYVNCIGVYQATDCQECPYHHEEDGCYEKMTDDILDLINRQKAEIERLKKLNDEGIQYDIELMKREKTDKAEAIKEFAERVKRYIDVGHLRPPTEKCFSELDVVSMIDNLVKEMVGDGDG